MTDRDGEAKEDARNRLDRATGEWTCTDPMAMTVEERERFLASVPSPITYIPVSDAERAAWRWYMAYESARVGVVFEGSDRVVIGVSRDTRAAGNDAFEVDFDPAEGVEAYRFQDGVWVVEAPLLTYRFSESPRVYMGADAERLRKHVASGTGDAELPQTTEDTAYDYR